MDITVASLLPYAIQEVKPGLIPDTFRLEPSDGKIPSVLHINDCKSNLYIRDGKTFPIVHPAEQVANAIVNDFCIAQLQAAEDAKPALFWVPGKHNGAEILVMFKEKVAEVRKVQNVWFMRLVRLADDDWHRTGQHRAISDIQRFAARSLGMINKPWYSAPEPEQYIKCPACMTLIDGESTVCMNCNYVVNKEKAKELGIKVA